MSRNTVTLIAPNGAKVRTVRSKRYFVVRFGSTNYVGYDTATQKSVYSEEYKHFASVAKRTDSPTAARTEYRRNPQARVYCVAPMVGGENMITDVTDQLDSMALIEKNRKARR